MEGDYIKGRGACPKLLDLIPNERDWMLRDAGGGGGGGNGYRAAEEKKLELRLGPPGEEDWAGVRGKREDASVLCLGYLSKVSKTTISNASAGAKRMFLDGAEAKIEGAQKQQPGFGQMQAMVGFVKELSKKTNGKAEQQQLGVERQPCCRPAAHASAATASGAAAGASNGSQTRNASIPVVGWPPIRSFRKNLASGSSKPSVESQNEALKAEVKAEDCQKKALFVKINMDGIPIGRKIDLKAYDCYQKLSSAVEDLFSGLLAAQRDPSVAGTEDIIEDKQAFIGLLDGSGEYTLVYEDNEGDRMLVGDVPWNMFVSTAKRLRVLKSSELSALSLGAVSRKRTATES